MSGKRHIILIGFSGSGKSTIGPLLAARLGMTFVDLDASIEKQAGRAISDIFRTGGEKPFRDLERRVALKWFRNGQPCVIGLGGGAFENPAVRELALEAGVVVYLSCSVREIYRRVKDDVERPLLKVRPRAGSTVRRARLDRIGSLLKKRLKNYRRADIRYSTTNVSPRKAAAHLRRLVTGFYEND